MSRPAGWTEEKFENLNEFASCNVDPSRTPAKTFELFSVPAFPNAPERVTGAVIGSTKQLVEPNDVLICKINPRINRVWKVSANQGFTQIASSEWIGFRVLQQDARYYLHYFRSAAFREMLKADVTGVGGSLTRAQPKQVAKFVVNVPPLAEQRRIADKLDIVLARVDAVNDRLARVAPLLKRFRRSVLVAATSGTLTADWRESQGGAAAAWTRCTLSEVAHEFAYGSAAKSRSVGEVPVLRMGNIQAGALDWDNLVYTSDQNEINKYRLRDGDVLFNRTNSPELVGKSAVFRGSRLALFAGYLIRVRCGEQLIPEYLNYNLCSPAGRAYCWQVKTDGVSQSNINAVKLRAFPFDLPGLSEQQEIVRRVELLFGFADRLAARLKAAHTATHRLTPAILSKAFRGELVPQDPNDEPASELLRRVALAREQSAATKFSRRKKPSI